MENQQARDVRIKVCEVWIERANNFHLGGHQRDIECVSYLSGAQTALCAAFPDSPNSCVLLEILLQAHANGHAAVVEFLAKVADDPFAVPS